MLFSFVEQYSMHVNVRASIFFSLSRSWFLIFDVRCIALFVTPDERNFVFFVGDRSTRGEEKSWKLRFSKNDSEIWSNQFKLINICFDQGYMKKKKNWKKIVRMYRCWNRGIRLSNSRIRRGYFFSLSLSLRRWIDWNHFWKQKQNNWSIDKMTRFSLCYDSPAGRRRRQRERERERASVHDHYFSFISLNSSRNDVDVRSIVFLGFFFLLSVIILSTEKLLSRNNNNNSNARKITFDQ